MNIQSSYCYYIVIMYKQSTCTFITKYKQTLEFVEYMINKYGMLPPVINATILISSEVEDLVQMCADAGQIIEVIE